MPAIPNVVGQASRLPSGMACLPDLHFKPHPPGRLAGETPAPLWQTLSARATLPALPATRAASQNTQQKKASNV
jgi:hypothetical protein